MNYKIVQNIDDEFIVTQLGPMWDGNNTIRYEDRRSYDILSA